jgi:NitT/TauT family transport system permease protein
MMRSSILSRIAYPLIALAAVLAIWQGIVIWWNPPAVLLPGPLQVLDAASAHAPQLAAATSITLIAAVGGLALSLLIGSCIAMLFSQSAVCRASLYPYAIFLQTVPIVAIAPIIVIWFGEGTAAVIVIAFIVSLFPIITNGTTGMIAIPRELQDLFALHGATRWQTLSKLQFPHALPYLVTGAKISAGLSVLGAIVGEYFAGAGAARPGLGYLVFAANRQFQMDFLLASVITCTLLGVLLFSLVSWVGERRLLYWLDKRIND